MKKDSILLVDACVRKDSRTRQLAERVLETLDGDIESVKPADFTEAIKSEGFLAFRDEASAKRDFSDEVFRPAKQFANADIIVIAAPYWDLSFPAVLKAYFEQINVVGLTFEYSDQGVPIGLCRARKLIYVTTAGGTILSDEYGYGYVKALATAYYGISDVSRIKAEGLDIIGADVDKILEEAWRGFEQ